MGCQFDCPVVAPFITMEGNVSVSVALMSLDHICNGND